MTQASPTNLLYAQAIKAIDDMAKQYALGKNRSPDAIIKLINNTLTEFNKSADKTLTKYEPVAHGEVPRSEKMNRFLDKIQTDMNIVQDQVDILNAAAVFTHNFIKTEILKAQTDHKRIQSKLKVLKIYSETGDDSTVYFGDSFIDEENIDWDLLGTEGRSSMVSAGQVTLGIQTQQSAIGEDTKVYIMDGSNGFPGNNQEIEDPKIKRNGHPRAFEFKAETNRAAGLSSVMDDNPSTWFEFERCWVSNKDRAKAKNFNFEYKLAKPEKDSLLARADSPAGWLWNEASGSGNTRMISWATGAPDGKLKLNLHVDLGELKILNVVSLLPFGLSDNSNNPFKVIKVSVSSNKTNWIDLNPTNVWIANSINEKLSSVDTDNIVVGKASWILNDLEVRYIRFQIVQPNPIPSKIGHLYYLPEGTRPSPISVAGPPVNLDTLLYDTGIPYNNALPYGGTTSSGEVLSGSYSNASINNGKPVGQISVSQLAPVPDADIRRKGPNPPASNPTKFYGAENAKINNLIQKVEFFNGKRWAIGIRDISFFSNTYSDKSVLISKQFNIAGIVDRVSIEADIEIPESYPSITQWEESYVAFEVSPDNGKTWIAISRIQDDVMQIPEIIAFNDPTPVELRLPGVGYETVDETVDSLRVKITIRRPEDSGDGIYSNTSPIVKSYKLKVLKRT